MSATTIRTDHCRGDDCWVCHPADEPRVYVCDGCMARVLGKDVAVWADFEHVLCMLCAADRRLRDLGGGFLR